LKPLGKWDGGKPIGSLPKSVSLNRDGYFLLEELGLKDRLVADALWPPKQSQA